MNNKSYFFRFMLGGVILFSVFANAPMVSAATQAQLQDVGAQNKLVTELYDTGAPALTDIWVDAVNGNDANNGATPTTAFRTLTAAWNSIPTTNPLTQGRRINLQPGTYTASMIPNYWETRYGTFAAPIFIRGNGSARGQVVLQNTVNMYDVHYIYFENLSIVLNGDAFHCEKCNHILLRNMVINGGARQAQETIKINQSQYVYLENNDISGAWDNAIDFVAVQYGHVVNNQIHNAGDWCAYAKGGSAYLRVEANVIYDCGTGGFTAGQGTGFQFMSSPWIQYEAYDIKVVNNIIHDTEGAGLGVNGGYNILMAYNTMYRVGSRDHVIEVVFGLRSCDGQPGDAGRERCQQYLNQGGWGTTVVDNGSNAVNIPNKNVFIYNNIVYNPSGFQSQWQHFAIYDSRSNPAGSGPNPARTDTNLNIRGNVIWNGSTSMPLGIESNSDACTASNTTCNLTQLRADNAINTTQPQFVNPATGDFHLSGTWSASITTYAIPNFVWDIASVSAGNNSNAIPIDFAGTSRVTVNPPGAYTNGGVATTFADVPASHPQYKYIQALYDAGLTSGCSTNPLMFCPDNILDRAQSAVFMVRGQFGSTYTPPAAPWNTFLADSWVGFEWAQPWAEGMYIAGLTQGCQTSPLKFCPANQLPRVEASIFGLKMKYGQSYLPPPATGTLFADFPSTNPSYWGIAWAEKAYTDGLLPACGTSNGKPMFCPGQLVNRGWGAYLIVKAKGLPTP